MLVLTSMSGNVWYMNIQKVYNWPSNKCDLRLRHDRFASSRPSHAIRKSIGINSGPRTSTTSDRHNTLATDLQLTSDALWLISDWPTTWVQPPRVTCVTLQKFAWDKDFKSDLRPIYDRAEWHMRPSSELWPICKDLRPKEGQAAVGSLANEIDKFHHHFWYSRNPL